MLFVEGIIHDKVGEGKKSYGLSKSIFMMDTHVFGQ
jgi:hypothetical protein